QIVSLLLTMSRGSIAATIIFAFVFALLQLRMRARYLIAAVMAAATAETIMLLTDIGSTVRDLVLRPSAALAGRDVVWGIGLDIWGSTESSWAAGGSAESRSPKSTGWSSRNSTASSSRRSSAVDWRNCCSCWR